jgi:predicted phosphohydrolase
MLPGDDRFTQDDDRIYGRELIRLDLSLSKAAQISEKPVIVMLHYPPFNEKRQSSGFVDLMERYNVNTCIYGHLHGESLKNVQEGEFRGIRFVMVSCDYLDFHLKNIF